MTFSLVNYIYANRLSNIDRKELVDIENILVILEYTDLNRECFSL